MNLPFLYLSLPAEKKESDSATLPPQDTAEETTLRALFLR